MVSIDLSYVQLGLDVYFVEELYRQKSLIYRSSVRDAHGTPELSKAARSKLTEFTYRWLQPLEDFNDANSKGYNCTVTDHVDAG